MRSISQATTSPGFIHSGGRRAWPTPDGVPVAIPSPGSRVITCDSSATLRGTGRIRGRRLPVYGEPPHDYRG